MEIGIVGGGINGLCCAWALSDRGHRIRLFERSKIMQATSSASSKLLHGGVRYLETGQLRLVREALIERDRWLSVMPQLARPLPIIYPKYRDGKRSSLMLGLGFGLYGRLSGSSVLPTPRWLDRSTVMKKLPDLDSQGLEGGYCYYDVQMDDYRLGQWVAEQCMDNGVEIHEDAPVLSVSPQGALTLASGNEISFDRLLNVTGPWAEDLLDRSRISSRCHLDLVRGSHLIVNRRIDHALILEVPGESRIFFVLPWEGQSLVGTTEIRQHLSDAVICSEDESLYLVRAYNHYFHSGIGLEDVVQTFSGLRPLLRSSLDPGKASREYAFQRNGKLVTVFGGKWTTARALANKVTKEIE
jgi:glycerol-3-phosphate dehydrogenase